MTMMRREVATHTYTTSLEWSGSTADGYESYDRGHRVNAHPAKSTLQLSGDAAFRGDPDLLNPEQLLLVAASSCQLLSFLAVAARARLDVISYSDEAEAIMPEDDKPMRIARITLRPRIVVAGDEDEKRIRHYVEVAHRHCFIANSLSAEIVIEPQFELR